MALRASSSSSLLRQSRTQRSPIDTSSGGSGPAARLDFISPFNILPTAVGTTTVANRINQRFRLPMRIGSADVNGLRLMFNGWAGSAVTNYANDYNIVSLALERVTPTALFTPVTFNSARNTTITAGSTDNQTDLVLPSAFAGQTKFAVGDLYWLRGEYSVASAGQVLPTGAFQYSQYQTGSTGFTFDPATSVVGIVDATGLMTVTSGFTNSVNPLLPIVLGIFVVPGQKSIVAVGDSIVAGTGDTPANGIAGAYMRALFDTDGTSNPIASMNMANSGNNQNWVLGANAAKYASLFKYAKYGLDEEGTNVWLAGNAAFSPGPTSNDQQIWTYMAAGGIKDVIRTKLIPRTTSSDGFITPINTATSPGLQTPLNGGAGGWVAGGNARLFNDWLDTQTGAAQGVTLHIMNNNSLRAGSDQTQDPFYIWIAPLATALTGDGTHPNATGAASPYSRDDYRAAIDALP